MTLLRLAAIVSATVAIAACSHQPTALSDGALRVVTGTNALTLQNSSIVAINYFVVERVYAAGINWTACVGANCPAVPAEGEVTVPFSQIAGYAPGAREAVVYWWHSVINGISGLRPDTIRALVARL
jgi:hypothetical protein